MGVNMKISLKILLLLVFVPTIISASTLERRDSLRVAALEKVGMEGATNQMPLVNANRAVNVAIQWVSSNFPAVEKAGTDTCSNGVVSYAIGDTTFKKLVWVRILRLHPPEGTQSLTVLKVIPADSVYEYVQEGKPIPGVKAPLAYAYAWAETLYVSPTPAGKDILMYGYESIGLALLADDSTTEIHPMYRELIVERAAYLIREELELGQVKE
jgi:hypothetical protein